MPAFDLNPSANSATYNAWTQTGGTSKWQNMIDASDATDVRQSNTDARQAFVIGDVPADADSITAPVTVHLRNARGASTTGTATMNAFFYNGTLLDGSNIAFGTVITNRTSDFATGISGAPWTPAMLNGCEAGVRRANSDGQGTIIVYEFDVQGNYETASGGFAWLIGGLIGAMLGGGLLLQDMPGISREVALHPRPGEGISIIQPHEYERALRELKADPHRRHFFMRVS